MTATRPSLLLAPLLLATAFAAPSLAQEDDGPAPAPEAPEAPEAPQPEPAPPAAPQKASLAVMPFAMRTEVAKVQDDHVRVVIRQFETTALTNKFIAALVNSRKFDVVDRQSMDKHLEEMGLSDGGFTDPARAVKAGKVIGADYFLMGEISVFTIDVLWKPIPYSKTGKTQRIAEAHLVCDMRIVDTRSSKIVAAEKGEVRWRDTQMLPDAGSNPQLPADLVDELQRGLADDLVQRTVDRVYPIKVTGARGNVYYLNRGLGMGLEKGQVLDVWQEGDEAIVDVDTGEALGFTEVKLGQLVVTDVQAKLATATPRTGGPFPKGSVCRKVRGEPAPDPAPTPRGPRGW